MTAPLQYLATAGPRADPATALAWGLIWLSVAVVVIITVLVPLGVIVRRRKLAATVERGASGLSWIYVGMTLTVIALAGALVWTLQVLAAVAAPHAPTHLTLEVTGRQWWWQVRYGAGASGQTFDTANEIHIPVGQPVEVRLMSADVIHSFWVPALSGKTDTIPGRVNIAWLQADRPGVYSGQCTEFCGLQHAHMAFTVVAQTPADFEAWRQGQLTPATEPASPDAVVGEQVAMARCGRCHTIRGTAAHGVRGPDLTHLMSRASLASGTLPNTIGALHGWIADPQSAKPGALMPATYLTGNELADVGAYLEILR